MRLMLKFIPLFLSLITGFLLPDIALCQTKTMRTVFETNRAYAASGLEEPKVYRLKKQVLNADFAYPKLKNMIAHIGDTVHQVSIMPIFNPVKGKYRYYQFIATFKGEGYRGIEDFHDILILKTNAKGKIVDAYQYTFEWAEMPLQYDLYRSSVKHVFLTDNLDISQLKFFNKERKELNEKSTLKLN
jgi:hypothetical protein